MKIDAITFKIYVEELEEKLVDSWLQKIFQSGDSEFIFRFRTRGENYFLFLTLDPDNQRIHSIPSKFSKSKDPGAFCMLLRKHLAGGKVLYANQSGSDRILEFHISSFVESEGEIVERVLIIELTGKTSNMIICDNKDRILGVLNRKDPRRDLSNGAIYEPPPPPQGINPFLIEERDFISLLSGERDEDLAVKDRLFSSFTGMTGDYVREILFRSGVSPGTPLKHISIRQKEKIWESFHNFFQKIQDHDISPVLYYPDNDENMEENPVRWALWDFEIFKDKPKEAVKTIGDALEACYFPLTVTGNFDDLAAELKSLLKKRIKKVEVRIQKQQNDLDGAEKAVNMKKWGELILANLNNIPSRANEVELENYYEDPPVKTLVKLDPSLSPSDNAQKYFNKYKKAKRGLEKIQERIEISREELSDLETALYELEEAENREDIESIAYNLDMDEIFALPKGGSGKKKAEAAGPRKFNLASGYVVLVGRNSRQNEEITLHLAQKDDLWFHTRQIPGSHVVLRIQKPSKTVPDEIIYKTACIAAFYSKARKSSKVPVDYTLIKDVRKVKGQKAGKVFYVNEKTLFVKPEVGLSES